MIYFGFDLGQNLYFYGWVVGVGGWLGGWVGGEMKFKATSAKFCLGLS